MQVLGRVCVVIVALVAICAGPAGADLSAFVASVGFDEEANLERGMGIGVRWGKSSGIIGGETSLLIARPDRQIGTSSEAATALFYEGRLLVNIPLPGQIKPFAGVGFGAVTITSTDVEVPASGNEAVDQALNTLSDLSTNSALSYGAGVRYALSERLDMRVDLRQYLVFSVKGLAQDYATQQIGDELGVDVPDDLTKDNTVQYNELSFGVNIRF